MRNRWFAAAGVAAVVALTVAGCGSSSSSSSSAAPSSAAPANSASASSSGPAVIKTEKTSLGMVLTNSRGLTLYWFAKDTSRSSACTGSCAAAWPPVIGSPSPATGVTLQGTLGTITRTGGQMQATYKGHPLYLYVGDSKPGQVNGNKVNAYGGLWYAVTVSGSTAGTSSSSSGSSGGYGGY